MKLKVIDNTNSHNYVIGDEYEINYEQFKNLILKGSISELKPGGNYLSLPNVRILEVDEEVTFPILSILKELLGIVKRVQNKDSNFELGSRDIAILKSLYQLF